MKRTRLGITLYLILLLVTIRVKGSDGTNPGIVLTPDNTQINTTGNELVTIILKVQNKKKEIVQSVLAVDCSQKEIKITSRNNTELSLNPSEIVYMPFKIYVPSYVESEKTHVLSFQLKDLSSMYAVGECTVNIHITRRRSVILYALTSSIQLESNTDSIKIPVRVKNTGNTLENITVVNGFPYDTGNNTFHMSQNLDIKPFSDTTIYFRKKVTKSMLQAESFEAFVKGFYTNGELFGMSTVRIQCSRSSRLYDEQEYKESFGDNYLSFISENTLSPYKTFAINSIGSATLPNAKINYSLDATVYENFRNATLVRNTWIGYQSPSLGFRAGSVDRYSEINLSGRGATFFIKDTVHNHTIEAGVLEKSYNLLERRNKDRGSPGNAGWLSFSHDGGKIKVNNILVVDNNTYTGLKSSIISNEFVWTKSPKFKVTAALNGALARDSSLVHRGKLSSAGGINIEAKTGKFSINSTNYISQASYPGMRQGTTSLSEQVNYLWGTFILWGSFTYYDYSPSISFFNQLSPQYGNSRIEIGASGRIFDWVTLSVSPVYYKENSNYFLISNQKSYANLKSWNLNSSANFFIKGDQSFSINNESGFYNSVFSPGTHFHSKLAGNYRYKSLNFFASVQHGNFFLGEAANTYSRNLENNRIFNGGAAFEKEFRNRKGHWTSSFCYVNNNVTGNNFSINSRLDYRLFRHTSFFGALSYYQLSYKNDQYQSNNLQVGLVQNFPTATLKSGESNLDIFIYKDVNQNNIFDHGDSVAINQPLLIGNTLFVSEKSGIIRYKHLPSDIYTISIPFLKGWYSPEQRIHITKDSRIEIGLQKTGVLEGDISYLSTELSYEMPHDKSGIMITASNSEGKAYHTKTNDAGKYVFYLPAGTYNVSIKQDDLPSEIDTVAPFQGLVVSPPGKTKASFILKIKERKIEIKKFRSARVVSKATATP